MSRVTTWFTSGETACQAWLYLPDDRTGKIPVIVMAHGLGGVKDMRLDAYAERFSGAGYGCLVFDYRHFGGSDGQPRQLLSVTRQLEDWTAAISFARGLPECDPDRIIVWGTSFSGGHAITIASRDHRLAAAIAQCPFTDGIASCLRINPLTGIRLAATALRDRIGSLLGRGPVYVPLTGAPGTVAFMTASDAVAGMLALVSDGMPFENRVTARTAVDVLRYRPGRQTGKISCPMLFAICDQDSVAPAATANRHAAHVPQGQIRHYDAGHFDIYLGNDFERALADQLEFLRACVPPSPRLATSQ